jgi:hypothetical protein
MSNSMSVNQAALQNDLPLTKITLRSDGLFPLSTIGEMFDADCISVTPILAPKMVDKVYKVI